MKICVQFFNLLSFFKNDQGIIDMRGIRLFHSEYKDEDSEQDFFSRYKIGKLQLLDVEILMEHTLSGVHSPNLIWLRWHECHLSCLPSWIPMKNLWVLEVHGTELKTLWPAESQVNRNSVCPNLCVHLLLLFIWHHKVKQFRGKGFCR